MEDSPTGFIRLAPQDDWEQAKKKLGKAQLALGFSVRVVGNVKGATGEADKKVVLGCQCHGKPPAREEGPEGGLGEDGKAKKRREHVSIKVGSLVSSLVSL
jgi:hypothetical protein